MPCNSMVHRFNNGVINYSKYYTEMYINGLHKKILTIYKKLMYNISSTVMKYPEMKVFI